METRKHTQNEARRGLMVARVIKLAIRMAQRGVSMREIQGFKPVGKNDKTIKMFYRDIHTLEAAGIPVYDELVEADNGRVYKNYRVDAHFMRRFM